MNFRDQKLTCEVCSNSFIFTVTEQRVMHEAGQEIVAPARCPDCRMSDPETGRCSGRIKWFNHERGYGFIVKPNGGEVFFHRSHVIGEPLVSLDEGLPVTFKEMQASKGPEAHEVKVMTQ
jgi:cold shock protein